jgi:hypothetical protein
VAVNEAIEATRTELDRAAAEKKAPDVCDAAWAVCSGSGRRLVGDQNYVAVRVFHQSCVRPDEVCGGGDPLVPGGGEPLPRGVDGGVVVDEEFDDVLVTAGIGARPV